MATVSFTDLKNAAERQDWEFVGDNIDSRHLTPDRVQWARENDVRGQSLRTRTLAKMVLKAYDEVQRRVEAQQSKGG